VVVSAALRVSGETAIRAEVRLIMEEPLEIRVAGESVAVTMRTPGHDRELTLGFLFCEGLISSIDDVGSLAHCGRTGEPERFNVIDVVPAPGARIQLPGEPNVRRGTMINSSCGVCGRRTIDDLLARCQKLTDQVAVPASAIVRAAESLRLEQPRFVASGGCHAACLTSLDGERLSSFEDVGRHNAVDKVVGRLLANGHIPATQTMLVVSGRVSCEVVKKAIVAGIPIVIGISAASSLAVDLAREANVTVAMFARGDHFEVLSGERRVTAVRA
jgi:FdhD protein